MENKNHRPQIETLACPYEDCHLYAQEGVGNLTVRKLYGKDRIRYLRCRACSREFSERKNTPLFNTKIEEEKAISVAEHLSEGVSTKGTSRLVGVSSGAVRRLRRNLGDHSRAFHDERVRDVEATSVQMDERYGYAKSKKEPFWEATAIDPRSRLLISFVAGKRDEALIEELMDSTKKRLKEPEDLLVMSDGHKSIDCASSLPSSGSPTVRRARETGDALNEGSPPRQKEPRPPAADQASSRWEGGRGNPHSGARFLEAGAEGAREAGLRAAQPL
jgi:transposase-like protein